MLAGLSRIAAEGCAMDDIKSVARVAEAIGDEDSGGVVRPPGRAGSGAASSSLDCLGITVPDEAVDEDCSGLGPITHIMGDRCKDWFCPHCAGVQGPRLRKRLIDRVEGWRHPMMLTFTIDRDLIPEGPEAAYKLVADRRAISKVMAELRPHLLRSDWFCVVEFQKDGGWPHWHVLCDSICVPIVAARKAWRRFVPSAVRHLIRPKVDSLGIVRFSKPDEFKSAKHAALYVSKYLVKYPQEGFPAWVMSAAYRLRRYSTSRGFWGEIEHRKPLEPDREKRMCQRRTHEQRCKECCRTSSVYAVRETVDRESGEVKRQRHFLGRIACHGGDLVWVLKNYAEEARYYGERLGLYLRGAFVSFLGTWDQFAQRFREVVARSHYREFTPMSLRFMHESGAIDCDVAV
jgi:hypothetical protein